MEMKTNNSLIYGCMGLGGGWKSTTLTAEDEKIAEKAIFAALEIGITTFDHADIYAYGKAEEVFGRVLKNHPDLRERIIIQSKTGICLHQGPNNSNYYNLSKEYIINQVHSILQRLQTEYLDALLLHRPDSLMVASEIAETFDFLKTRGLVRHFGVSNMSVEQVRLIQHYMDEPLIANQLRLSLGHSLMLNTGVSINTDMIAYDGGMHGMLEYCQLNHMAIQAWSPLHKGLFTRNPDDLPEGAEKETSKLLVRIAGKYGVSPSTIMLAWLFRIPCTIQPIIGTTQPDRIRNYKDACTLQISSEDWYHLWITARGNSLP